jgi:hypothetical protein
MIGQNNFICWAVYPEEEMSLELCEEFFVFYWSVKSLHLWLSDESGSFRLAQSISKEGLLHLDRIGPSENIDI